MTALVIHPGALGDVLLAVPALRAVRRARPGLRLTLAAQPRIAALLQALGVVDAGVAVDGLGLERLFVENGPPPGDRVTTAARVVAWMGAGDPVFVRRLRRLAPDAVVARSTAPGGAPVWRHLLGTVGATAADCAPVEVPARLIAAGRRMLERAGWDGAAPLLAVHPGAGSAGKRWPAEGFGAVVAATAARHRLAVVVHRGPADPAVPAGWPVAGALVLDEPPLPALAGVLGQAVAYLGNDSGISHLAAAVGVPSVVLFAPANLAWRPWWPGARPLAVGLAEVTADDRGAVELALEAVAGAAVAG